MGHGMSKKKLNRIAEYTFMKKNAMRRALIAFAVAVLALVLKNVLYALGAEWTNTPSANIVFLGLVVIAAAIGGMGFSRWKKLSDQIKQMKSQKK